MARRSTETMAWFSVETPSVFREISLPDDEDVWTKTDRRNYDRLSALAEAHGTYVQTSAYRRG